MKKSLFREKALERLSSPENLHEAVRITSSRSWLALVALMGISLSIILWAIFGQLPKIVFGQGILIQSGGITEVTLLGRGIVREILVEEGDLVKLGDTLAIVNQPELQLEINKNKGEIGFLLDKRNKKVEEDIRTPELRAILKKQFRLEGEFVQLAKEDERLERQIREMSQETANTDRLNRLKLREVRIQREVLLKEQELERMNAALKKYTTPVFEELDQLSQEIRTLRQDLNEVELKLGLSAYVKCPQAGKVIELKTKSGQLIETGEPVLSLEVKGDEDSQLEAIIYVPAEEGKKVEKGMIVQLEPSTVKMEEYGYLKGEVIKVSEYPATRLGMSRVLENEALVETFVQESAPIAVRVKLIPAKTPSKYAWTSRLGPEDQIKTGTLCRARIEVSRQNPLSLLFPAWGR